MSQEDSIQNLGSIVNSANEAMTQFARENQETFESIQQASEILSNSDSIQKIYDSD